MSDSGELSYDLIVIGSGPAGEKGSVQAAYFGKRVALIERANLLGGAAVYSGASSKSLRETALCLTSYRRRDLLGLTFTLQQPLKFREFVERSEEVMRLQRARISENLMRHGVDLYRGVAHFLDAHTISVKSDPHELKLTGKVILIASGSVPYHPPNIPFDHKRVFDSNKLLTLQSIPQTMVVVGGGTIACEYACVFAALGVKVTLIHRARLLEFMDGEISAALLEEFKEQEIECLVPCELRSVTATDDAVFVELNDGRRIVAEMAVVAAGRCGNVAGLGLDRLGIEVTERGHIKVNDRYQTSLDHIFAAGDVVGFPGLASTAMEQARVAMVHAFDLKYKESLAPILPIGVYTIPECAMAGDTSEKLRKMGVPFVEGKAVYSRSGRGEIIGERHGFLKLLYHPEEMTLLGVHILGEGAAELVHLGLHGLLNGATASLFINTCYNYPTLSELYKYATYDALGRRQRGEIST